MGKIRIAAISAAIAFGASGAIAADPLVLKVEPVWIGLGQSSHRTPYLVTITNNTNRDAAGAILSNNSSEMLRIPIEVARGTSKRVPVYLMPGEPINEVLFDSDAGRVKVALAPSSPYANLRIVAIGDSQGQLGFLKMRVLNGEIIQDPNLNLGYAKPEDAPDRVAGYFGLDAVLLSEGAERLNERQIGALKQYVVQGGRVVISGGANAPFLSIPSWNEVLPVQLAAPKPMPAGTIIYSSSQKTPYRIEKPMTVMLGDPRPGLVAATVAGQPLSIVRPVGLGSVIFLGYNPFEGGVEESRWRRNLVMDALKAAMFGSSSTKVHLAALSGAGLGRMDYSVVRGPGPPPALRSTGPGTYVVTATPEQVVTGAEGLYPHRSSLPQTSLEDSPFDVKLIPGRTIGFVFLGFFLVVVPLNFIVLRLIKRMELAWVTTPVTCFVFAGILLSFAGGLYSAKMSKAYSGFVVQDLDSGLSAQWIRGSWFFPRGGRYDLTLAGTDEVLPGEHFAYADPYMGRYGNSNAQAALPTIDLGEARLPDVDVSNLAFREAVYHRPNVKTLDVEIHIRPKGTRLEGEIRNKSNHTLRRVALGYKGMTWILDDLPAGGKLTLSDSMPPSVREWNVGLTVGKNPGQVSLFGFVTDLDFGGPGDLVPASSKVLVICTKSLEAAR